MGVKIQLMKQKGEGQGFTIPALEASVTAEMAEAAKMMPALRRIARQLVKDYKFHQGGSGIQRVIGVEFHDLSFTYILDTATADEQKVAERLMKG